MTTRRTLLASAAMTPIMATSLMAARAAQDEPATFVLVHGAWAGAWIWRDIIALLREAGHSVYASTATGMGDRAHLADPAIDLSVYVTDVVNLIEYEDLSNVTLVGWSFGGMIITGVAEQVPERLSQVVYFDASLPSDGQDAYDADGLSDEVRGADLALTEELGMPGVYPVDPAADWIRSEVPDEAVQEWLFSHFTPQPLLTWASPLQVSNPMAAALPHVYILCTADKDLSLDPQPDPYARNAARVAAEPNWRVVELDGNHLAPVGDPDTAAKVLLSLV